MNILYFKNYDIQLKMYCKGNLQCEVYKLERLKLSNSVKQKSVDK